MRLRVVCGLGEMMASFSPTSALSSVDFPAFGRPRMQTKPERKGMGERFISTLTGAAAGWKFALARPAGRSIPALRIASRHHRPFRHAAGYDRPARSPVPNRRRLLAFRLGAK